MCLSTTSANDVPVRQASQRHFIPRQDRLYFSDSLSRWNFASIDLPIAGPISGCRMSTRVLGSLRTELPRAGASTCPSRSSRAAAWAIAAGRTRLMTVASRSGSSSTSLKCRDSSISRPSKRNRSCSSRGSNGAMPVGSVPTLGSTFLASSSNSPASILRSRPVSIAAGERSQSSGAVLTLMSRCDIAPRQTVRLRGPALDALGSQILVEALGDFHEQARKQGAIGLHVAQVGEHLFDRMPEVRVLLMDLVAQRLCLAREAVGDIAIELAELIRQSPDTLFERLVLLAKHGLELFVGIRPLVSFVAQLSGQRVHLFLCVGLERVEIASR